MLLFIYVGLIVLGLVVKNSRIFDGLVIAFLCFIVATSTTQADYLNYKSAYDFLEASHVFVQFEPGWQFLCMIGHYAGLPYEVFVAGIVFLALLLLRKCMTDFGCNRSLFWSFFLIFPALIFLVQFRQFITLPIVLFALKFLTRKEPGNNIKFCVFILVASLIHSINIVYLLFLAPVALKKSKLLLGGAVFLGLVVLVAAPNFVQEVARYIFSDVKVDYYFSGQGETSLAVRLATVGFVLFGFACAFYINKLVQENRISGGGDQSGTSFGELSALNVNIHLIFVLMLPILILSPDFMRLFRIAIVLTYMLGTVVIAYHRGLARGLLEKGLMLGYATVLGYAYILLPVFDTVVKPLLAL